MKKNIVIFVHLNTWFTEMFRVAKLLKETSYFNPIICFCYDYPTVELDLKKLDPEKIEGIRYSQISFSSKNSSLNYMSSFFQLMSRIALWKALKILRPLTSPLIVTIKHFLQSLSEIQNFQSILKTYNSSLVIFAGDLVGYNCSEIVRAAEKMELKTLIIPSSMSDGTEQAEAYFFNPMFSNNRWFNKMASAIWPHWKKHHKNRSLVRMPAEQIISKELLNLAPPLPWIANSTLANATAVESQAMFDYYKRCGIDSKKLHLTGSLANDYLAEVNSKKVTSLENAIAELKIRRKEKTLVMALPPDSLYMDGGRPECEFNTYTELMNYWVDQLRKLQNYHVIISLHPSVDPKDYAFLESDSVKISKKPIVELIPLADIFVASVSSTIRWAIACSIPVVNYDVYKYRYSDFTKVKGVKYVDNKSDYEKILIELDHPSINPTRIISTTPEESLYWGNLDGREGERILKLIFGLVQ